MSRAASGRAVGDTSGSAQVTAGRSVWPASSTGVSTMTALWLIVLCGVLAILYAVWAIRSVLAADPGSARMQEIAAAVREGAQAYLKRQYTTIGVVGIVIFFILAYFLGSSVAVWFFFVAVLSAGARVLVAGISW